jgi:transposase
MDLLTMSTRELSRVEVMGRLQEKRLTQKEAAKILGIGERQAKRLWKRFREKGASGLVSKRRGKPSNNQMAAETGQAALDLLHSRYADFGPTLACEKLVESHGLKLSVGSVRKIMIEEGLWKPKKARKVVAHQLRERRACYGELVQIDGSPHDWFEGRAAKCTLLVFIDDATGKLGELLFVENESFFSYCQATEGYLTRHGKPGAFYSDKHGVFRVNQPSTGPTDALTQFGRAMQKLDIQIICANSPEAKGRVERANQTLQDRLPKELRLRGISSWEAGNAFLPEYMADFNRRFAAQPRSSHDAHRPLTAQDDLARLFRWQETRTLSKNLTLQFNKVVYQIQTDRPSYAMRNAAVTVCLDDQENITILYKGKSLNYTVFNIQAKQSEVVHSKQIDQALLNQSKAHKPAPNHPWSKGFATPLSRSRDVPLQGDISTSRD